MAILANMARNRAVKKMAKSLPPLLTSGYGVAETYTPGQVATAMENAGISSDFIDFAYAMFCSESDFTGVSSADFTSLKADLIDINPGGGFDSSGSYSGGGCVGGFGGGDGGGGE